MAKIFVTGANGYLGSTFLPYIPKDWEVIAFDSREPNVKLARNSTFIKGNITKISSRSDLLKDVDIVLHLAAIKGSELSNSNPFETVEVNVLGTHELLRAATLHGVKKFIFASTYWVYDTSANLPFTEETPVRPSELYGLTKAISEIEIAASKIDYLILRFTNIFGLGSGVGPEEVIFNFIKMAFEGKSIELHDGGIQKLDFIDIEDVCCCLLQIMKNPKISRCILNIGSGRPKSVSSVASTIRDIFQRKLKKIVSVANSPTEIRHVRDRWVSVSKLEEKIGKLNLKPFEVSIDSYIRDYKEKFYDSKGH